MSYLRIICLQGLYGLSVNGFFDKDQYAVTRWGWPSAVLLDDMPAASSGAIAKLAIGDQILSYFYLL